MAVPKAPDMTTHKGVCTTQRGQEMFFVLSGHVDVLGAEGCGSQRSSSSSTTPTTRSALN